MPRGYSFEHFQVPMREPRERATPPDSLKAATSHKGDSIPLAESQGGLHYGRKNAETVNRLRARIQERKAAQTEAPARATRAKAKKAAPARRASTKAKKAAPARRASIKAKAPARGGKRLSRVAAAAKTSVRRVSKKATAQRVSKKATARKTPKKR